jgi:hypothetical protein
MREISTSRTDTVLFDPSPSLCDQKFCSAYFNHEYLYRDEVHFRRNIRPETAAMLAEKAGMIRLLSSMGGNANDLVTSRAPNDACVRWDNIANPMLSPFQRFQSDREGHGFMFYVPGLLNVSDTDSQPHRSPVLICENNKMLAPKHDVLENISSIGLGAFSHYANFLVFSTSDNSDPNTNGRTYRYIIPPPGFSGELPCVPRKGLEATTNPGHLKVNTLQAD